MKKTVIILVSIAAIVFIMAICIPIAIIKDKSSQEVESKTSGSIIEAENQYDDFANSNQYADDNAETNDAYEEEKLDVSGWGFYNLDIMDNGILLIDGYSLNGDDDDYVYFQESYSFRFVNGFTFPAPVVIESSGELLIGAPEGTYPYSVIDNNTIYLPTGEDVNNLYIVDRKYYDYTNNFLVLVINDTYRDNWYVPFSIIDFQRGTQKFEEDGKSYYKVYLKN